MTQANIPAVADLSNLEFYSLEDFHCSQFECGGCEHELRQNERRNWNLLSLFEELFKIENKLGEGGFGHVTIMNHNL